MGATGPGTSGGSVAGRVRAATPRAGILVTGTEVLTGIISDRNGPWLSQRLYELGVETTMIEIVGDRPGDLLGALEAMRAAGMSLIVTSGGLGPTADDLTAELVGRFCGREMALDDALEEQIAEILRPLMSRWPDLDEAAVRRANRKQAVVPVGATVLDPVGTAPGLVVPFLGDGREVAPGPGAPTVLVLPGPPRELQRMWQAAIATDAFRAAIAGAADYRSQIVRLFGIPESEIATTLEAAAAAGLALDDLEITTCLRRGEVEVATRFQAAAQGDYDALLSFIRDRHGARLFSEDGSTVDEQVAGLLLGDGAVADRAGAAGTSAGGGARASAGDAGAAGTLAVAESCTAGLLAARLTERAGSSAYFLGGGVVYSNEAKTDLAGVPASLIDSVGAVSVEVAEALAAGIARRFGADYGVGITGVAGPGGGTPDKPVGFVCISAWSVRDGRRLTRASRMPGDRADIRDRSVTVAMHLLRRLLLGSGDTPG
jgi:nicotinamide-nucleotide amidase